MNCRFFKCGRFLPRTISKSGLSGKSLGENGKKRQKLAATRQKIAAKLSKKGLLRLLDDRLVVKNAK
jgi:hypothetical protein